MSNSNGIISTPIDLENDVYGVLQLSPPADGYDLGYACSNTHGKTNAWSRYKPVPFADVDVFNEDNIITLNGHSSWADKPITVGVDGALSRPWYMGGITLKLYTVPVIDHYDDMFLNGAPNPSSLWKYQAPTGSGSVHDYPYRADDFIGYNHNARCPISAYVSYDVYEDVYGEQTTGKTHIDKYIYAGFNYIDDFNDALVCKQNGELTFDEVMNMITYTRPLPLYLCIVIYNKSQNITRSYSKLYNIEAEKGRSFKLQISNSNAISQGGVAHVAKVGDVLEIGAYLSQTPDNESIGKQLDLGFSLFTGIYSSPNICRTVKVGENSYKKYTIYKIIYDIINFTYGEEGYWDEVDPGVVAKIYYVNVSDPPFYNNSNTIYSAEKGFKDISGSIKLIKSQLYDAQTKTWRNAPLNKNFGLSAVVSMFEEDTNGILTTLTINRTNITYSDSDITNNRIISNNGSGSGYLYDTQVEAEEAIRGISVNAYPALNHVYSSHRWTSIDCELSINFFFQEMDNFLIVSELRNGNNRFNVST